MEVIISTILDSGFERTRTPLPPPSEPLVVHAVAGAGKSYLARKLLDILPQLQVYTHGVADGNTLTGRRIQPFTEYKASTEDRIVVIDEYLAQDVPTEAKVLLCDPFQYEQKSRVAHFTSTKTRRFGRRTAHILSQLGFHCESDSFDVVLTPDVWQAEITGEVITFEEEWYQKCCSEGLKAHKAQDVKGATFKEVTVVCTSTDVKPELRHLLYVSLTRHRSKLVIATLEHQAVAKLNSKPPSDATNTPAGSQ